MDTSRIPVRSLWLASPSPRIVSSAAGSVGRFSACQFFCGPTARCPASHAELSDTATSKRGLKRASLSRSYRPRVKRAFHKAPKKPPKQLPICKVLISLVSLPYRDLELCFVVIFLVYRSCFLCAATPPPKMARGQKEKPRGDHRQLGLFSFYQ